jgi:hypothetical protein
MDAVLSRITVHANLKDPVVCGPKCTAALSPRHLCGISDKRGNYTNKGGNVDQGDSGDKGGTLSRCEMSES